MKHFAYFLLLSVLYWSCVKEEKKKSMAPRDTTITKEVSFSELFIDTMALKQFEAKVEIVDTTAQRIRSFYNQRNFQYAWFFPNGLAEFALTFINLQSDYIRYSGDSSLYNKDLISRVDSLKLLHRIDPRNAYISQTELMLTRQFFLFTNRAYSGNQHINTQDLDWFIPRRKLNTQAFLDSLLKNKGENVQTYEPVNAQYNLLKNKLLRYYEFQKQNDTVKIKLTGKLSLGKSADVVPIIKRRLSQLGDMNLADTTAYVDTILVKAVRRFQLRMGLKANGQIDQEFIHELNVPMEARIRQILINMERIRWMPIAPTTDYILVNIPEFQMHLYEKGKLAFNMVVVVGSEAHSTVIFSGTLNQIVFSPYWNVPPGILKNEILPGIRRNKNYLSRHNMEWHAGAIRQKPGRSNSLGLVKFLFPNSYNIYFHDTPSKRLFGETSRAFSHGCIRLSEPAKLAAFLLRRDSTWTGERISLAMNAGKEKYVRLRNFAEIPVFIGYFTSWVDGNGDLNFRRDVYGHDKTMEMRLFKQQIPTETAQNK